MPDAETPAGRPCLGTVGGVGHAPEETGFAGFLFPLEIFVLDEMHGAAEAGDDGTLFVASADPFVFVGDLAGVVARVRAPDAIPVFDVGFPVDVSDGVEGGEFEGGGVHAAEGADGTVHDVAGDALLTFDPRDVVGFVEGTIEHLAFLDVGEVGAGLDEFHFVGFHGIGGATVDRFVKPPRAEVVIPVGPGHEIAVVIDVHEQGEAELAVVIEAESAAGFFFGEGQGGEEEASQNGDDGDDDEQFNESEGVGGA